MEERNDGGPAFPCEWDYIKSNRAAANGMTLRDYFIAHAPAEPQPWFAPVMPKCPPDRWVGVPASLAHRLQGHSPRDVPDEKLMRFASRYAAEHECQHEDYYWNSNDDAQKAWEAERRKQCHIQWPAAWADAMLKARQQ